MNKITIADLAGQEFQIQFDFEMLEKSTKVADRRLWTYLISYPYFVDFFQKVRSINPSELILGNALAYSWMPTTMNLRKGYFEELLEPLNALKKDDKRLESHEFSKLKNLVNNSVTGTSKVLHFINPRVYPIWDSRINRFISGTTNDTNTISNYEAYLSNFDEITNDDRMDQITSSLSEKIDYEITPARAFEMIMYLSDLLDLPRKPLEIKKKEKEASIKIPRYKRDAFTFISNLGDVTANPLNPTTLLRDGYLLSEHYTDNDSIERALWVRSRKNLLISDNGNWTRMSSIADIFEDEGNKILSKAKEELAQDEIISTETQKARKDLIQRIASYCKREVENLDVNQIIETQLLIKPHYLIGLEDFTIPVLMMCGMLDETFDPNADDITQYQTQTIDIFSKQYHGELGFGDELGKVAKFIVLHAYDFESAHTGALKIDQIPKEGIAISYGAPMKSRRWIARLQFGDKWETFDEKLPESYLIAQSMTLGAVNGIRDDTPIHILGVGSPILITLIGLLLRDSKAVSIDSTAPFKDAYASKLYGSRSAFLKMDMYRVAALALINESPYESKTPFFKEFEKKYPSDWKAMHEIMKVNSLTDYKKLAKELEANQDLVEKYIPFFTKMRGGKDELIWDLRIARSGHNYWVLKEICEDIRYRKDDPNKLKEWTEYQVERYKKVGSDKWANAVEKAYLVTEKYRYEK